MPPSRAPGQISLDRIQLEVWWMSGSRRRTFTLEGYRPHVLTVRDLVPGAVP
jgi:hypothetical protein